MKLKLFPGFRERTEVVLIFGGAQLLRHPDGKMELRGGSKDDRFHVKEWISIFMHEAVIRN
jgi:hypothetical protein